MIPLLCHQATAKTGHERTNLERQIEATDRQIDRLSDLVKKHADVLEQHEEIRAVVSDRVKEWK